MEPEETNRLKPKESAAKKAVFIALTVFLVIGTWSVKTVTVEETAEETTILFSGTGEFPVKKAVGKISFTFSELNLDLARARETVAEKTTETYEAIRDLGIEDRDIKTTRYSIHPEYDYVPSIQYPNRTEKKLQGYRVSHSTDVRVRDLDMIGKTLDLISENRPRDIGGPTFTPDEKEKREAEERAITAAIQSAKERAERIAKQSNLKLKKVTDIYWEDHRDTKASYRGISAYAEAYPASALKTTTPITQGEMTVKKTAFIRYRVTYR